jgi:N-acetylneuraminic acid mutarotase
MKTASGQLMAMKGNAMKEPNDKLHETATLLSPHPAKQRMRFAIAVLSIASCLCWLPPAIAAPGSWTQAADLPSPASATSGCVVDGIVYVIGGLFRYYDLPLQAVWSYDPQTNGWTRKRDMPTARRFLSATAVDGIIYVIGGTGGAWGAQVVLKKVEAYDPKTDTWVTKADMPTGRGLHAACTVDGIIYAIGGTASWPQRLSTVEAYDPKTNQWTTKRSLPKGIVFPTASAATNGLIYAFMGTDTFAYDPQTDRWTSKAQYSPWSYGLMSTTVDGIIYLFGGMTEDLYGSYDFTLAYDPVQDRFSARRKMPRTRLLSVCGVIDGKVYLAGGVSKEPVVNPNPVYYRTVDVFDPQGGVTPQILGLTCESTNHVRLAWQGEAGILYGVHSRPNVANGLWTTNTFSTGTNSVLATNSLVEATCLVPTADTNRFFRVLEL